MDLSPKLEAEALKVASDANEDARVRATALMLVLGPVAEFPELARAASRRSLSDLFVELRARLDNLMEHRAGYWVPRTSDASSCITRLKAKIRASARIWLIHGGRSEVWKDVGRRLERQMGLRYVEFDDTHDTLVTERVTSMATTATLAVAVMSVEDTLSDGRKRARQNVIHEIGLAQGCLDMHRVLIMREQGIEDFTNMSGVIYISFMPDGLDGAFYKLQQEIESRLD